MADEEEVESIKLISAEGHEFTVSKDAAMLSGTIKSMLSTPAEFAEQASNEIRFREISTPVLEKVIEYFYFKLKYSHSTTEIPDFKIEPEMALDLLLASNFLDA